MAIVAEHGSVRARQRKFCLRMPHRRKGRRLKTVLRVAAIALIQIRRPGELSAMRIDVAIVAKQFSRCVGRRLSLRLVAFHTIERSVFSLELKGALLMRFPRKQCRLEICVVVARGAFRPGGPLGKLTLVNVLMAIFAMLMRDGTTKIAVLMALRAHRLVMFAVQRKFRIVVIEICTRQILAPSRRVVTGLTRALKLGVLEGALMRIGVAVLAAAGRKAFVVRDLLVRLWPVAHLARYRLMLSG